MDVHIHLEKSHLVAFIVIFLVIGAVGYVQSQANPAVMGHSWDEINVPADIADGDDGFTTLADLQAAVTNDFHNLGGTDQKCDTADSCQQVCIGADCRSSWSDSAVTKYYSVSLASCGFNHNAAPDRQPTCGGRDVYWSSSGAAHAYFDVNLPHGAVVTQLRTWTPGGVNFRLRRSPLTSDAYDNMAQVTNSGTDRTIDFATIDNQNYKYLVEAYLTSYGNRRITGIRIGYTI